MKYKITLIDVGRGKVNKVIETKDCYGITEAELRALKEADKCLMSSEVEIAEVEEKPGLFDVIVGGFRKVGQVRVEQIA